MRTTPRATRLLVPVAALALLAAACGDDSASSEATTTAAAAETTASETTAPETTLAGSETTAAPDSSAPTGPCEVDESLDEVNGKNAGRFVAMLKCAAEKPLKAEGEPIVIGVQNPEGDPAGSFPEYSLSIKAAADYINNELGGIGGDPLTGKAGRPIKIDLCTMAITPADSQRCANELIGKNPFIVISTTNFFGNHLPIYQQAGVTVVVASPITIADFTSTSAFAIGAGGGCLGVHTGLIYGATQPEAGINGKRVGVFWADTPPGVVCYYDLEQKPLEVLKGTTPGTGALAGTMPDLEFIDGGVAVKPATPDVTPQVTQMLAFNPDVLIFSGQASDCWNLVDGLGRQGWTPDKIPMLMSGPCIDFEKMKAAGDLAKGLYFISSGSSLANPDAITNPRLKFEAETYLTKAAEYGLSDSDIRKGYASNGFSTMLTVWEQLGLAAELTPAAFTAQFAQTSGNHIFGSVPFGCADAVKPYVAVCNSRVNLVQWDGEKLNVVLENYSGVGLIEGTELQPGPK